ncbi:MAG TPA: NAD(P)-dependent alcohol dehydrogenase [Kribbella sp.]|uniref:NAD(P)-dependent alcohol dehydrogenase n=1 Tax=Kribbella sp. TaxID=1871183 RepID=UPI002D776BEF|nr:NAD(P)-dependent alcohol dehydrogenase [Kribbella sp.]HET6294737.1 NAD(P)-dependent alcohol dehydrogenase [Kribbella sp.]
MKAIVQDTYGSADVLRYEDIDQPVAGSNEVLIRVRAAGVDIGTWHLMTGKPYLMRLALGFRAPKVRVRGRDVAGVVEAVGSEITKFKVGDEVYGTCDGSFAEYTTAPEGRLALKPSSLGFDQAAVVPISGGTALQGLRDLKSGQKALIIGAAGGVGTFAVQLAKARGAHVTGVCSTTKLDLVCALGADEVIDYTRDKLTGQYDFIVDTAGTRSLRELRGALSPRGTLVMVGGETGGRLTGGMERVLGAAVLSLFVGQKLRGLISTEDGKVYDELTEIIEAGDLSPVIGHTYSLPEAPDAVRQLTTSHARGKIVITV